MTKRENFFICFLLLLLWLLLVFAGPQILKDLVRNLKTFLVAVVVVVVIIVVVVVGVNRASNFERLMPKCEHFY